MKVKYSSRSITCENDTCPTINISQNNTLCTNDINKNDKLRKTKLYNSI